MINAFQFKVATRYLFSKKSTNAINIISIVSVVGMAFGTLALILVLSIFNGFEGLVMSLYNIYDPDVKVTVAGGKVFSVTDEQWQQVNDIPQVAGVSRILEEKAAFRNRSKQIIGVVKGVDEHYGQVSLGAGSDSVLKRGAYVLNDDGKSYSVVTIGVEHALGLYISEDYWDPQKNNAFEIILPQRLRVTNPLNPQKDFVRRSIKASGTVQFMNEYDADYIFVPLNYLQKLFKYKEGEISALEISLRDEGDYRTVKKQLETILGPGFNIKDRFMQNEFLYRVMRTEKWVLFALLSFILIIAAFNIIGSLSMLVLEKRKDISILKALGATTSTIRGIFLCEGLVTSLFGGAIGALLAVTLGVIQQQFKIIPIHGDTFLIDAYPVEFRIMDFVWIILTVVTISLLASWFPAARAARQTMLIKGV